MDVHNLMIGNWMHSKLNNTDARITCIECPEYNSVWLDGTENWQRHHMHELEPIPITEEFLKLNGFKPTEANDERLFHQDGLEVWIDTKGARHWINILVVSHECKEMPLHYYEGEFRYVHQLQHALRLCGIDKEIIIKDD